MTEPNKQSSLLKELTRRRIFRTAGAYVVVAWVAIQVGSIIFPEFEAPDWAMRGLILIFIAGFPPAMLLAWTLDISAEGISRTPESSYSRAKGAGAKIGLFVVTAGISAAALWWLWDDYIVRVPEPSPRVEIKSQPVIAVQPPRQLAGRSEHDWLGAGIANLVRSELSESQHVIVVSALRWAEITADVANEQELLRRARSIGVDYLVDGELIETPRGIVLTLHVEDVENGIQLVSPRGDAPDEAELLAQIPQLGMEIKQALRIPHQERVGLFEADFAIRNIEAYEAYIAGLAYLIDFEYQAAERAFEAVLSIAPDYHIARFRLAQLYEATGRSTLAIETLDAIPADANLSRRLELYIEGARAYFAADRDPERAIDVYSELVESYPYEMEARTLLAEAYWLGFRDDAAIEEFRRVTEIHPYDPMAWMALGERLLDAGRLAEAGEALERYAEMRPEDAYAHSLLGKLAMMQGDLDAAIGHNQAALERKPGFVEARLGLARSHYLGGNTVEAGSLWQSVIDDPEVAAKYRIDAAFELAGVRRGQGRFRDSLAVFDIAMPLIREEGLRLAMALSESALAELELGNHERAGVLLDEALAVAPSPASRYLFARGLLELELDRHDALARTVEEIRAIGAETGGAVQNKAANYLAGLAALDRDALVTASELLEAAVAEPGYPYAIYRLGLARYHRAAGDLDGAVRLAETAASERDAGDLRLDLELDRARARLLLAQVLAERGDRADAERHALAFLDRWRDADADLPELALARALSGEI